GVGGNCATAVRGGCAPGDKSRSVTSLGGDCRGCARHRGGCNGGDAVGGRRSSAAAHRVGGNDREGVGGAVGQTRRRRGRGRSGNRGRDQRRWRGTVGRRHADRVRRDRAAAV